MEQLQHLNSDLPTLVNCEAGQTPSPFPAFPLTYGDPFFPFPIHFPPYPPLVPILYPARGSEERCELSHQVRAASPAAKRILVQRRPKLGMALG